MKTKAQIVDNFKEANGSYSDIGCCGGDYCEGDHEERMIDYFISLPLSILETLREKVDKLGWEDNPYYYSAIDDVLALLDEQITALK